MRSWCEVGLGGEWGLRRGWGVIHGSGEGKGYTDLGIS